MNLRHSILLLAAALVFVGCSEQSQKTTSDDVTSLGSFQTRDRIIRLETNSRYSILDMAGRTLALSITKSEFQEKFPLLYQDFEKALANGEITIDASVPSHTNEIVER